MMRLESKIAHVEEREDRACFIILDILCPGGEIILPHSIVYPGNVFSSSYTLLGRATHSSVLKSCVVSF